MTDSLLKTAPDKPCLTGDGVSLMLADGKAHEVRFTARAIIRVENTYGSHEDFETALDTMPVGTLASVLLIAAGVTDENVALDLLDGVNWRPMILDVRAAWKLANWEPSPTAVPTTGS
jgi:hypothetical protein